MSTDRRIGLAGVIVGFFSIAAFYIWPNQKWIGWSSLAVAIAFCVMWFVLEVMHWANRRKPETAGVRQIEIQNDQSTLRSAANAPPPVSPALNEEIRRVEASEWQSLASRFERIGRDVRADWQRMSDGIESWNICGGRQVAECEALCKLGGAMLMKSLKVLPSVSPDILAEQDAVFRWLYFLKAKKLIRDMQYGLEQVRDESKPFYFGTIYELGPVSYRTCIECSAMEI